MSAPPKTKFRKRGAIIPKKAPRKPLHNHPPGIAYYTGCPACNPGRRTK